MARGVNDRQLVTVVGFIAVLAYLTAGLLAVALLAFTRVGHSWPVLVAVAGLGAGMLTGLVGLAVCGVLRWRRGRAGANGAVANGDDSCRVATSGRKVGVDAAP